MAEVTEKIVESKYVVIPKTVLYTSLIAIIMALVGSWIRFEVNLASLKVIMIKEKEILDKDIKALEKRLETEESNYKEIRSFMETMNDNIADIKSALNLKQDKKFVE